MTAAVLSAVATWAELHGGVVAREAERDLLAVRGPDTFTWLQGQLSQDVSALAVGASVDSLVLSPQGRIDALVRVTRRGETEAIIDVDTGYGPAVLERLSRFRLRVRIEIAPLDWRCVELRGPGAAESAAAETRSGNAGVVASFEWPGLAGLDLLGPAVSVPAGVPVADESVLEAARIAAGVPRMGRELTGKTIPQEAGIVERAVSFTKGCYTGQELVARIDSRGSRVPWRLRGTSLDEGASVPESGAELSIEGRVIGTVTSAVAVEAVPGAPGRGGPIALAYVRREVVPPAACTLDGDVAAVVEPLPLWCST